MPEAWRRGWAASAVAFAAAALAATVTATAGIGAGAAARGGRFAAAPTVNQLVVFRNGDAVGRKVRASAATVRAGGRRCAVGAATPLAALVRSRPGAIGLRDYASCSRRAADGGGLYVRSIRRDRGRGQDGWIYKVGHKQATAGAGDPAGPFGRGRLRSGQRLTWFYCLYRRGCQRTLELRARSEGGGLLSVRVRGYDDAGRGATIEGASVSASGQVAVTDATGTGRLRLAPGRHTVRASKAGLVRSFGERVTVRP